MNKVKVIVKFGSAPEGFVPEESEIRTTLNAKPETCPLIVEDQDSNLIYYLPDAKVNKGLFQNGKLSSTMFHTLVKALVYEPEFVKSLKDYLKEKTSSNKEKEIIENTHIEALFDITEAISA